MTEEVRRAEEYVREYDVIREMIGEWEKQIEEMETRKRESMDSALNAMKLKDVPGSSHANFSLVEQTVQKIIDVYECRIVVLSGKIMELYQELDGFYETMKQAGLTAEEIGFVRSRYFDKTRIEDIQELLGYSESQCWRIRRSALLKIGKLLKCAG